MALCKMNFDIEEDIKREIKMRSVKEDTTIRELMWEAIDDILEKYQRREIASKKAGTGGHRAAKAIRKMSKSEKSELVDHDRRALAAHGIDSGD